jgi:hypothetical protein
MQTPVTIAKFATSLRASSLAEALYAAGIHSQTTTPKWVNKRLPPPKIEVAVDATDLERAKAILVSFSR